MTNQRQKRVLIYKRTHEGDPDSQTGEFGNNGCMGQVRSWEFNAVIGVGGIRPRPECKDIACKLTWIGIGAHKDQMDGEGNPLVTFNHFLYLGETGSLLKGEYPTLAKHMYDKGARVLMATPSYAEWPDVEKILELAGNAPPSHQLKGAPQRNVQETRGKC